MENLALNSWNSKLSANFDFRFLQAEHQDLCRITMVGLDESETAEEYSTQWIWSPNPFEAEVDNVDEKKPNKT